MSFEPDPYLAAAKIAGKAGVFDTIKELLMVRVRKWKAPHDSELLDGIASHSAKLAIELRPSASVEEQERVALGIFLARGFDSQAGCNVVDIMEQAHREAGDSQDPNGPSHDWWHRIYEACKPVSDKEMQELFARLIAGELKQPGCVAFSTIEVLRRLDTETARIFQRWCSMSLDSGQDLRLLTFGRTSYMWGFGLSYADLQRLDEVGLIRLELTDWQVGTYFTKEDGGTVRRWVMQFEYLKRPWYVRRSDPANTNIGNVPIIAATRAGTEIGRTSPREENRSYTRALRRYLDGLGLQMFDAEPDMIDEETGGIAWERNITPGFEFLLEEDTTS